MSFSRFLSNPLQSRASTQPQVTQKAFNAVPKRSALGEISNNRSAPGVQQTKKQAAPAMKKPSMPANIETFGMDVDMADGAPAALPAGVDDIDRNDFNDPQMVSDYVTEIHAYMRNLEVQQCGVEGYMAGVQTEIKPEMRAILVDWLVEVHARFKLIPETLQLTVNIMDRYLEKENTKRKELQLIGVTAMLIASKYEEMYPPEVRDFIWIADNAYSRQAIVAMEGKMLKTLDYNLGTPLPTQFFERGSKASGAANDTKMLGTYFMELSLCSYEMVKFTPSEKAAAALCLSRQVLQQGAWSANLAHFMGYTASEMAPALQALTLVVQNSAGAKQQAIRSKYKRSKFDEISENAQLKSFVR